MALIQKAFSDIITFSRSSNATRIGPTGLVEYAPHNLLQRSQEFDNASWTKGGSTITANAVTAPDGTVTADKLVEDSSTGNHWIFQNFSNTNTTISVFAKAAERNFVCLTAAGQGLCFFNLSTGTVVSTAANCVTSITSVGNGWYRCSVAATGTGSFAIIGVSADGTTNSYTGTTGSGIYIWGAQLAVGPYALDYTPTTSAAVYGPRFDYDPVTLAARGLLVEEQRTNLLTYSEQFNNSSVWNYYQATVTANTVVSPDGTTNADTFTTSLGLGSIYQLVIGSAGQTISVSCYVKAGTSSTFKIDIAFSGNGRTASFDVSTGTTSGVSNIGAGTYATGGTASIQSIGNGWYRCLFDNVYITGAVNPGFVVASNGFLYAWGAQFEVGGFSTSYIPTLASTVTRSADVASVNTLSPWYSATEGTLYSEWDISSVSVDRGASVHLTNTAETDRAIVLTSSSTTVRHLVQISSVFQVILDKSPAIAGISKDAYAYKAGSYGASVNGTTALTSAYGSVPAAADKLFLGAQSSNNNVLNGWLRRVAYYPRRLTNAELQALTA